MLAAHLQQRVQAMHAAERGDLTFVIQQHHVRPLERWMASPIRCFGREPSLKCPQPSLPCDSRGQPPRAGLGKVARSHTILARNRAPWWCSGSGETGDEFPKASRVDWWHWLLPLTSREAVSPSHHGGDGRTGAGSYKPRASPPPAALTIQETAPLSAHSQVTLDDLPATLIERILRHTGSVRAVLSASAVSRRLRDAADGG